ncbi:MULTISPECIES: hypothetical protein [unclassified Roseitalea]|uniref:hypothetical protein n=1 Tax=unclassified Roseitalea TaxID=2639107 RepID=UPI00273DAC40|nr:MULTISPECIES: hypothetical protein [unclassified Roseitalea]
METGLVIFLLIGAGIVVLALVVGRFFRRTVESQMPGADQGDSRAWWYATGRRNGDDGADSH